MIDSAGIGTLASPVLSLNHTLSTHEFRESDEWWKYHTGTSAFTGEFRLPIPPLTPVTPIVPGMGLKRSFSTPSFRTLPSQSQQSQVIPPISYGDFALWKAHVKNFLKADIPLSKNSSHFCPHKHHCFQNAFFKGFFRTFAASYIFKTTVTLSQRLFGGKLLNKKLFQNIRKVYLSEDPMRFALFVGLMSFTYKAIICSLRRYRQKDPIYHKAIAGFIAAGWCAMDDGSRRKTLAMYLIVRSIGDMIRLGVHRKDLPSIPGFEIACFTWAQLLIMYSFIHAPKAMDPKYYQWIRNMCNVDEKTIQATMRSNISNNVYRLSGEPFRACSPGFHKDTSCLRHNTRDFLGGMLRAARIYIPVHFLPMLLFTPKKVFSNPSEYVYRKALNTLRSSVFLSTYQFNSKMTVCMGRNILKDDPWYLAVVSGFFGGLSLLIEHSKRRGELCMYVIPRSMEVLLRLVQKKNFPKIWFFLRSTGLNIVSFQIAIALWMALINTKGGEQSANALNMTVLRIIFGSKH